MDMLANYMNTTTTGVYGDVNTSITYNDYFTDESVYITVTVFMFCCFCLLFILLASVCMIQLFTCCSIVAIMTDMDKIKATKEKILVPSKNWFNKVKERLNQNTFEEINEDDETLHSL